VSITDRVLDALKAAILLEARVSTLAENVGLHAKDIRDIDKRLLRVEAQIEFGMRGNLPIPPVPPVIDDQSR